MKRNPFLNWLVAGMSAAMLLALTLSFSLRPDAGPVEDVFKVMEIAAERNSQNLWPGFDITHIPLLVCDSIDTWLFFMEEPLEGFMAAEGHPGVWYYKGQHPLVRGNSIIRSGNRWVATSLLSSVARRTGERYRAADLAGIIIHEQFHVFQRLNHPGWRQNDGVLLVYPPDDGRSLSLRRMEKDALRRAVIADNEAEMCGWAMEALRYRKLRMEMLDDGFRQYERELQRTEGLSDYIERTARNLDPLNASDITSGIAPAGIRDMGYVEGRWIAMLLDRLSPAWKDDFELDGNLYLEDILEQVINEKGFEAIRFTDSELDHFFRAAEDDLMKNMAKKTSESDQFRELNGYSLEIDALSRPLSVIIFEPLEFEILDNGSLYHRLIFSAGNEAGSLRVMNQPCMTWFDRMLGVERVVINGIKDMPEVIGEKKRIVLKNNNITIDLGYTNLMIDDSLIRVEL
ncbi:MAG: hypothetical protein IH591_19360 [Bacteroidales bacterium]|nr:hypothetical protein [Bacteroidales bacterium]